ncbi:hypothetical protein COX84_04910 [Candidatus Micrarchaeota archaeon CG_4_10_14_0_2_um_filter_49_7]|nr:MAG: hypothetical protein COS70_04625 [Candidatus Micrarchaeota archaeon CG06_land_8_20_14_3_00_50_6]PIZ94834.1 MAG: hypothetical protein COX84_04910 [Candidatus Micrarchaeota archaeon CG_4_10_14_0_2_um_filter_49_7]HII54140.1 hypothetical protein [Candidatus Micrarchaeota archaeon]
MTIMRAQVSIEYIVIVSVLLLLFVPVIYYAESQRIEFVNNYAITQTDASLSRLASIVDYVYFLGEGNEIIIDLYFPTEISGVTANPGTYEISATVFDKEIVKTTRAKIFSAGLPTNGILLEGMHRYLVRYSGTGYGVDIVPA